MVELWTENYLRRNLLQSLEEYPNKHILAAKRIPPVKQLAVVIILL